MLRYRLEGSGSPLLLVHGWGVSYAIWQNLAPFLTPYYQLIMIELPGVGESPQAEPEKPYYEACAEAIEELRQTLGVGQWSMLAYSSGTRAAEAYIQRYPRSITRAIFLCPIYLQEIWSLFVRLLGTPHPHTLTQWIFSDWRLYNLIRAVGFNWERHDYTYVWQHEIELQPLDILVRSLYEMPGQGRTPFELSAVPTLFVWGRQDVLTATPRRPRPNDVVIPANHSAPMLAASSVAEVVLPFLTEGKLVSTYEPRRGWLTKGSGGKKASSDLVRRRRDKVLATNSGRRSLLRLGRDSEPGEGVERKSLLRRKREPVVGEASEHRRLLQRRSTGASSKVPTERTRLLKRMRQTERTRFLRLKEQAETRGRH